jgi:hypothetical protein
LLKAAEQREDAPPFFKPPALYNPSYPPETSKAALRVKTSGAKIKLEGLEIVKMSKPLGEHEMRKAQPS